MRCLWIAAAVVAGLVGCENGPSSPPESHARSVRISQGDTTLRTGATDQLTGEVLDASGGALPALRLSWSSSDAHIASVDSTGLVSAATTWAALVIARYSEFADTVAITVLPPPVAAISVWPDTNVIFTGMTRTLSLSVVRGSTSGSEPAQSWTTSDPSVATVTNGVVTAVGSGHVTVTASIEDHVSPAIDVFVLPAPTPALLFSTWSGSCGLTTDGLLYCWDTPFVGMPGPFDRCRQTTTHGDFPYRCSEIPRLVSTDARFKTLTGGPGAGCALTFDGAIYCWGGNTHGEAGLGFTDDLARGPTRVPTSDQFVEVAGGSSTNCARRIDGVILCWGSNWRGDTGTGSPDASLTSAVVRPTPINTSARFVKLSSGDGCGLATDSTAYCWGSFVGGDSAAAGCNTGCSLNPVQVKSENLVDLETSLWYCGIGVSGRAYCWGFHGSDPYRYADPQEIPNPGFRSLERGLYALDASGVPNKLDSYAALWRFNPMDTGQLRYKRYWGDCGIALDDRLYCGTQYGAHGRLIPGQ